MGVSPAPTMPFLSFSTDDKKKKIHHEALADILKIFKKAGMKDYNLSHIDDPEKNPDIPIKIGPHLYDLSFHKNLKTIVLLEVKILKIDIKRPNNGKS
jgi:hypothetical protein